MGVLREVCLCRNARGAKIGTLDQHKRWPHGKSLRFSLFVSASKRHLRKFLSILISHCSAHYRKGSLQPETCKAGRISSRILQILVRWRVSNLMHSSPRLVSLVDSAPAASSVPSLSAHLFVFCVASWALWRWTTIKPGHAVVQSSCGRSNPASSPREPLKLPWCGWNFSHVFPWNLSCVMNALWRSSLLATAV